MLTKTLIALFSLSLLSACASTGQDIFDPYEEKNRKRHELNKRVDQNVLSKAGNGIAESLGEQEREVISSVSNNLGQPSIIVNRLLQFKFGKAIESSFRFAINSTVGVAGMFDIATKMGIPDDQTDFGITLGVWGVPEGAYLELPYAGPSTTRDAFGKSVNIIFDPAYYILPRGGVPAKFAFDAFAIADSRAEFDALYSDLLYNSEDSYAAARLYYLQNRRFLVTGEVPIEEDLTDPTEQEEDFSDFDEFYQ